MQGLEGRNKCRCRFSALPRDAKWLNIAGIHTCSKEDSVTEGLGELVDVSEQHFVNFVSAVESLREEVNEVLIDSHRAIGVVEAEPFRESIVHGVSVGGLVRIVQLKIDVSVGAVKLNVLGEIRQIFDERGRKRRMQGLVIVQEGR